MLRINKGADTRTGAHSKYAKFDADKLIQGFSPKAWVGVISFDTLLKFGNARAARVVRRRLRGSGTLVWMYSIVEQIGF